MVGQDGNAVLQTVDTSGGIIQLVGTTSNPINFATSMEVGQLYSCSGRFTSESTTGTNITFLVSISDPPTQYLIYKYSSTQALILNASIQRVSANQLLVEYSGNSTVLLSFNSSGLYTSYSAGLKLAELNGTNQTQSGGVSVYAPITSGTAGQILQSNGSDTAPTWTNMPSTAPVTETLTIESTSWSELSDSSPYTYNATVTATTTIGTDSIVELINNQAVLFATYGFAIGSISGQNITIYSIGQPSTSVTLTVGVTD